MQSSRRDVLKLFASGVAFAGEPRLASAQNYPVRPIHWIVSFPPGGSNDIIARIVGPPA